MSVDLDYIRKSILDAYTNIRSADEHWLVASINGLDMFWHSMSLCLTAAELGPGAEENLYRTMQRYGLAVHTGRFKHYSSVYGIPESLDEQKCVILSLGKTDIESNSKRFVMFGNALSEYFSASRYHHVLP